MHLLVERGYKHAAVFLASIAENESRIRSRSMEVSLAQRLNGGLPLTPKLLGYSHDADGKLVINPDEAPTVKLIFYMYLSGYSSSHIAKPSRHLVRGHSLVIPSGLPAP